MPSTVALTSGFHLMMSSRLTPNLLATLPQSPSPLWILYQLQHGQALLVRAPYGGLEPCAQVFARWARGLAAARAKVAAAAKRPFILSIRVVDMDEWPVWKLRQALKRTKNDVVKRCMILDASGRRAW